MTQSYFFWPQSNVLRALALSPRLVSVTMIEEKLRSMFPTGHPVLCSSGRAALVFALMESGAARGDLVGVFPYASHCVLDAVSRIATPLSGPTASNAPLRIVYHQWGFVQELALSLNAIEDCVDTLCIPGTNLFPGGGRFEIWSLPKILGTTSGGILWCRNKDIAQKIRKLRDQRGGGLSLWILRLIAKKLPRAYYFWQGAEVASGGISRLQTGEIYSSILRWGEIVADRKKKLNVVWPLAVAWLKKPLTRFPTVVPIIANLPDSDIQNMGISSGYRMFDRLCLDGSRDIIKVLPLPIHQDIHESWLEDVVARLISIGAKT